MTQKAKPATLNIQPSDKGKVVSIMYLRKGKGKCSVDPENVAQPLVRLMQERRCAPRLGILCR